MINWSFDRVGWCGRVEQSRVGMCMAEMLYRGCRFAGCGARRVFVATVDWWAWFDRKERGRALIRVFDAGINPESGEVEEREAPIGELWVPPKPATSGVRQLRPRYDLAAHCREFDWGCDSMGARQLGVALLADQLPAGRELEAVERGGEFTRLVVAQLAGDSWSLSGRQIGFFLAATFEPE